MDVGPARQPRSPLVFQVGAEPHFPRLEWFPTLPILTLLTLGFVLFLFLYGEMLGYLSEIFLIY